ncbi:MAG TPA: YjbE family putative metal transport protein [Parasulfuritortus sp.]
MGIDGTFQFFGISLQVFLVDLLLSGDNAVVIALACRSLPAKQRRQAMIYGAGAGILLRLILSLTVNLVLLLPLLKIIGAIALLLIAIDLMTEEEEIAENQEGSANHTLSAAVMTIVAADLVMSLDNVVALAAVSHGSFLFLGLGLLLSVPLLIFGSGLLSRLMDEMPGLITLGGALLGWVAGGIAVTDPLIAGWVDTQSPALTLVVPLATALLAVMQSRRLVAERRLLGPQPRQSLRLPMLWTPSRPAEESVIEDRPDPTAPATVEAAVEPAGEATAIPAVVPIQSRDEATLMDDEHDILIGDRQRTAAPAGQPDAELDAQPAPATATALWDIKVALGLAVVVTLLVMVMSVVTEKDDSTTDVTHTPDFSVAPTPDPLQPFQCGVYDSVVYYHHGSMQIRFQADSVKLSGVLNRNAITWKPQPPGTPALGFTPPTTVLDDSAKTVTVKGGSFPETVCQLATGGAAGR